MHVTADDLFQLFVATLIAPFAGPLAGAAIVWLGERAGWVGRMSGPRTFGLGAIAGLCVLPSFDALAIRWIGLGSVSLLHAAAGVLGLAYCLRLSWPPLSRWFFAGAAWWCLVALFTVDVAMGGALYQSTLVFDLVKHGAVVEAIVRSGLPLSDPFFNRPGPAGYYYYFYLWGAQTEYLSGGLASGRLAFTATAFWTAIPFIAVMWETARAAHLIRPGREARFLGICAMLFFVSGLDFPLVIFRSWAAETWIVQAEYWTEEVRFASGSVLWTPHHILSLLSVFTALLAVGRVRASSGHQAVLWTIIAGSAFAAAFGSSVWIMLTAVAIFAIWALARVRRDPWMIGIFAICGMVGALLASAQILDLLAGRAPGPFPVGLTIRPFMGTAWQNDPELILPLLLFMPFQYALQFGVFALGTYLYFRARPPVRDDLGAMMRSLLVASAIGGLIVMSFFKSTIINNDLGWRAPWFAQLPAMIWTAAVMQNMPRVLKMGRLFTALLVLGFLPNLWNLVSSRIAFYSGVQTSIRLFRPHPYSDYSQRAAYGWANAHLPPSSIVQHNPATARRIFDFGLYGHFRTGVADRDAVLFGASRAQVQQRIALLRPIYEQAIPADRIKSIARSEGIDALLFTDLDPIWRSRRGPPVGVPCAWRDDRACVALVKAIP